MEHRNSYLQDFSLYLQQKGLSPASQQAYGYSVKKFLSWYDGELILCRKKEILDYLSYLKEHQGQSNVTRQGQLYALTHYFDFLLKEEVITSHPTAHLKIRGAKTRTLHHTYTLSELDQLYDDYQRAYLENFDESRVPQNQRRFSLLSRERNAVMLGFLIYQGIVPRAFNHLRLEDIDLAKARVCMHGRTRATDRTLPLEATQIGALIRYLDHIRPQFFEYCDESERVFFALPASGKSATDSGNLTDACRHLSSQLKTLLPGFQNFRQIRASRIVHWLQTEGLRKTQYLAGHKSIVSTEEYLPGNLEQLSGDIDRFNPFASC